MDYNCTVHRSVQTQTNGLRLYCTSLSSNSNKWTTIVLYIAQFKPKQIVAVNSLHGLGGVNIATFFGLVFTRIRSDQFLSSTKFRGQDTDTKFGGQDTDTKFRGQDTDTKFRGQDTDKKVQRPRHRQKSSEAKTQTQSSEAKTQTQSSEAKTQTQSSETKSQTSSYQIHFTMITSYDSKQIYLSNVYSCQ
ncbi:hypothetical protein Bpfe_013659 [Biomphalaria pfeifferi]|uniref:Uncharacterized protein n=1 Tax=Biomphalaria pfeifferi TaxID=112525 RepID=A0AAD8BMX7_BIOPF|nr:hypothetical protein Bpfe_013659 [Biomphalaria pfeifferi]